MLTLSNLITWARLRGPWISGRFGQGSPLSSRLRRVLGVCRHAFGPCRLPAPVPIPVRVPRLRCVAFVPALMLAGLVTSPAGARSMTPFELTADGRLVDVQVLVGSQATPLYFSAGRHDRRYFQAFRGRNYALALTNNTGRRIGVLIAVDGLNVVNGERSRLASGEPMYVLDPWERVVIRGWRTSLKDVRQFVFVDEERSYAQRTGQANGDLGWIRVLAFREQGSGWYKAPGQINERERDRGEVQPFGSREQAGEGDSQPSQLDKESRAERRELADGTPRPQSEESGRVAPRAPSEAPKSLAREDAPSAQSVPGTGWGNRRRDPVQRVWFVAQRKPADHLVFRYEYASGLRALGIVPRGSRDRLWERERGELGFAQPPRW